jgi:predicted metal-binding membrane protein
LSEGQETRSPVWTALLRRESDVALAALALITTLSWLWVLHLGARMSAMDVPEMASVRMSHLQMLAPGLVPWSPALGGFLFVMWAVMMIAMMTPSVAPMILVYLQVARHGATQGVRFASAGWFLGGYLIAWTMFAALATIAQWALESTAMMTPAMRAASPVIGGAVLIAAGLYQWLPLKYACLSRCRAPLSFIQEHGGFQPQALASMQLGLVHGLYCVGCCWALMALLFVGGIMNLLWIAGLMAVVLLEKLLPRVLWVSRGLGVLLMLAGVWIVL